MNDKKRALELLEQWIESREALQKLCSSIAPIFGNLAETEFFNTVWDSFDHHTTALGEALGDKECWLEWYVNDNGIGASSKEAMIKGKFRKIETLKQLLKAIENDK